MGLGVQVARGEGRAEIPSLQIGAHLLEKGLALDVGVLSGSLAGLVCQGGAALSGGLGLHSSIDLKVLLDELVLEGVEIGADADAEQLGALVAEGTNVHEDVVDGVLGLLVVHDVLLFAVIVGDILIAEVGADLGEQCRVQRNSDGVGGTGEHLPLDGRDLGVHALTDLEEVGLGASFGTDGVDTVGVGVEAGDIFAAVAKCTDHLKGVPVGLAGLEEQGLDLADHGSDLVGAIFLFNRDDVVIRTLGQRGHEVIAALDIASPLINAGIGEAFAIGLGNVELAVGVLGKALLLRHGLDALGVEAVLGVIKVDIVIESADVGVE